MLRWSPRYERFDVGEGINPPIVIGSIREGRNMYSIDGVRELMELSFDQVTGIKMARNEKIFLHFPNFPIVEIPSFIEEYLVAFLAMTIDPVQFLLHHYGGGDIHTQYFCSVKNIGTNTQYILKFNNLEYLQGIITGFR